MKPYEQKLYEAILVFVVAMGVVVVVFIFFIVVQSKIYNMMRRFDKIFRKNIKVEDEDENKIETK